MYKVIKIIDENQIVVNAGANKGIRTGQVLEIYELGDEVKDPETGVILGTLDYIKATINVKHVFEKMSICVNDDTETTSLTDMIAGEFGRTRRKPLNVDATQISGGLKGSKKIKIGDLVRDVVSE